MVNRSLREMVREFALAFGASHNPNLWVKLVQEEVNEFENAFKAIIINPGMDRHELRVATAELLKEVIDVSYVCNGLFLMLEDYNGPAVEIDEGLILSVEVISNIVQNTYPIEKFQIAFERVHASNMSKLGEDGKPVRRDDGKIMKGPNYRAPYLMDLINP
jgi:hypothetical protein